MFSQSPSRSCFASARSSKVFVDCRVGSYSQKPSREETLITPRQTFCFSSSYVAVLCSDNCVISWCILCGEIRCYIGRRKLACVAPAWSFSVLTKVILRTSVRLLDLYWTQTKSFNQVRMSLCGFSGHFYFFQFSESPLIVVPVVVAFDGTSDMINSEKCWFCVSWCCFSSFSF